MRAAIFFCLAILFSCGSKKSGDQTGTADSTRSTPEKDSTAAVVLPAITEKARLLNQWLTRYGTDSMQVITDAEAAWPKDVYDYFIAAKRAVDPDYPYIATGDFDGDGSPDQAALVRHRGKPVYELAIISGDSSARDRIRFWKEDIDICAVSLYPKGELQGIGQPKVKMRGDGVNVEYYEKASFVIYWDGKKYTRAYTGD